MNIVEILWYALLIYLGLGIWFLVISGIQIGYAARLPRDSTNPTRVLLNELLEAKTIYGPTAFYFSIVTLIFIYPFIWAFVPRRKE